MTYPSAPKVPRNTTPAEFLAARSACKEHQQYSKLGFVKGISTSVDAMAWYSLASCGEEK